MRPRGTVLEPPVYPLELSRVDLAPYREGNTGIDHVHSFDSGVPGPHVMVNALTHGNELCGMVVVRRLLDAGIRPRAGRLTLAFANVAAYDRFAHDALQWRFVDRDFNRLWSDALLAQDHASVEARRAHALAPVLRTAIAHRQVSGEYYEGTWYDVGTPERLHEVDEVATHDG